MAHNQLQMARCLGEETVRTRMVRTDSTVDYNPLTGKVPSHLSACPGLNSSFVFLISLAFCVALLLSICYNNQKKKNRVKIY